MLNALHGVLNVFPLPSQAPQVTVDAEDALVQAKTGALYAFGIPQNAENEAFDAVTISLYTKTASLHAFIETLHAIISRCTRSVLQ